MPTMFNWITSNMIRDDMEGDMKAHMMYAVTVVIKLREDYGLTLDIYDTRLWLQIMGDCYEQGKPSYDAAFLIANSIQKG